MTPERARDQASELPDPTTVVVAVPPAPPPIPESGNIGGMASGSQSKLTQKLAEAQDTHRLAAHQIVDVLRETTLAPLLILPIRHAVT